MRATPGRVDVSLTSLSRPNDFARHYHWPNTHLPSATSLAKAVQDAAPGRFVFHHLEDHGIRKRLPPGVLGIPSADCIPSDYPRTLREWGRYVVIADGRFASSLLLYTGALTRTSKAKSSRTSRSGILSCEMKSALRRSSANGTICSSMRRLDMLAATRR